ncbi:MAG: ATP-binding protein [Myxococcota bacterium]
MVRSCGWCAWLISLLVASSAQAELSVADQSRLYVLVGKLSEYDRSAARLPTVTLSKPQDVALARVMGDILATSTSTVAPGVLVDLSTGSEHVLYHLFGLTLLRFAEGSGFGRPLAEQLEQFQGGAEARQVGVAHALNAFIAHQMGQFGVAGFHATTSTQALSGDDSFIASCSRRLALEIHRAGRGYLLDAQGLIRTIEKLLDMSSEILPPSPELYLFSIAQVATRAGDLKLAERAMRESLARDTPLHRNISWLLVEILYLEDKLGEIAARYNELCVTFAPALRFRCLLRGAEALARTGKSKSAQVLVDDIRAQVEASSAGRVRVQSHMLSAQAAIAAADGDLVTAVRYLREFNRVAEEERFAGQSRDAASLRDAIAISLQRTQQLLKEQEQRAALRNTLIERQRLSLVLSAMVVLLSAVFTILVLRSRNALAKARDEANAANLAKSRFLATMSHEIRTPMNGVLGFADLLADSRLNRQQREFITHVRSSGRMLSQLLNDILDLSKIEAGALELESIPFAPSVLCREIVQAMSARAADKGVGLGLFVDEGIPNAVSGDPVRIRQVLLNLVGNGIKFTERGGVAVHLIRGSEPCRNNELQLELHVVDTGIGIPADKQEGLFDPFRQVDASTTRKYGGSGLGLSICRQLCELMGGHIEVQSEVGQGSRFIATFKVSTTPTSALSDEPISLSPLRALVIERLPLLRETTELDLIAHGAKVFSVLDAQDAEKILDQGFAPDIVLTEQIDDQKKLAGRCPAARWYLISTRPGGQTPPGFDDRIARPVEAAAVFDRVKGVTTSEFAMATPVDASEARAHVLVAEDDRTNQALIRHLLGRVPGITFEIVDDGYAAVEAVKRDRFDLVLMDMEMPRLDGLEATRQILDLPNGRTLPIVALTANVGQDDRLACERAGMVEMISKPIERARLTAVLDRVRR